MYKNETNLGQVDSLRTKKHCELKSTKLFLHIPVRLDFIFDFQIFIGTSALHVSIQLKLSRRCWQVLWTNLSYASK